LIEMVRGHAMPREELGSGLDIGQVLLGMKDEKLG
jgi:hypothetical protein